MKINELILEFEMPDVNVAKLFGKDVSAKDVANVVPGVDPDTVVSGAKKAYNIATTKLFDLPGGMGPYTVGDAMIDVPLIAADIYSLGALTPALMARFSSKVAANLGAKELEKIAARKATEKGIEKTATPNAKDIEKTATPNAKDIERTGIAAADAKATKKVVGSQVRGQAGHELAKNVNILPDYKAGSATDATASSASKTKQRRYKVGDLVATTIKGKTVKIPVKNVLPSGYELDASTVPESPTKSIQIPEPLSETSDGGGTVASDVAVSTKAGRGNSAVDVLRRYAGSPGKMGKGIPQKPAKSQTAKDNPITNKSVGGNLIA
jgi:hypothetical protein